MAKSKLVAKQICDILKASSNIKSIEWTEQSFKIEFFGAMDRTSTPRAEPEGEEKSFQPEPPKVFLTDEDKEVREELHQLQLVMDDPVAFEQAMIDAHGGLSEGTHT